MGNTSDTGKWNTGASTHESRQHWCSLCSLFLRPCMLSIDATFSIPPSSASHNIFAVINNVWVLHWQNFQGAQHNAAIHWQCLWWCICCLVFPCLITCVFFLHYLSLHSVVVRPFHPQSPSKNLKTSQTTSNQNCISSSHFLFLIFRQRRFPIFCQ